MTAFWRTPAGLHVASAWLPIQATAYDPLGLAHRVMILSGCRCAELRGFPVGPGPA
jgi:hypothetical protein